MANAVHEGRKASASALPRGVVITALALMSWGIVLAGWKAATLSFSFLIWGCARFTWLIHLTRIARAELW